MRVRFASASALLVFVATVLSSCGPSGTRRPGAVPAAEQSDGDALLRPVDAPAAPPPPPVTVDAAVPPPEAGPTRDPQPQAVDAAPALPDAARPPPVPDASGAMALAAADGPAQDQAAPGDRPLVAADATPDTSPDTGAAGVDLVRGLVAYWKLDDAAGAIARDSSGNNLAGGLMNFVAGDWTTGRAGGGLTFDSGRNTHVVVANAPLLNPTAAISMAAWIKPTDWNGNRRLIQKGNADNQYRLTAEDGMLKFHLAGVTNGDIAVALPAPGAWHHVAAVYDGARLKLAVDGTVATRDASGPIGVTADSLHLGTKYPTAPAGDQLHAVLDEVIIYGRALADAEIAALAAGVLPMRP